MIKTIKLSGSANRSISAADPIESVADILDRELKPLITDWLARVEEVPDLTRVSLSYEERTGHLPKLVHDVTARVRLDADSKASVSEYAARHGELPNKQGYRWRC